MFVLWNKTGTCGSLMKLWYPSWTKCSTGSNLLVQGLSKLLLIYSFPAATADFAHVSQVNFACVSGQQHFRYLYKLIKMYRAARQGSQKWRTSNERLWVIKNLCFAVPLYHSESCCIWPPWRAFGGRTSSVSAQLCCSQQLEEFREEEPNQSTGGQLPAEALSHATLAACHSFTCICRNWCSEEPTAMVFPGFSLRYCKNLVRGGSFMSWDGPRRWWSLSDCWNKELLVLDL